MTLELALRLCGLLLIALALGHAFFPLRFGWKEETKSLSLLTRQVFYVHHFFIALVVGLQGALCLIWTDALLQPTLAGRVLCGGLTIFWLARLLIQFLVYDSVLWRGHAFNTRMHIAFSLLWVGLTIVFGAALRFQLLSGL